MFIYEPKPIEYSKRELIDVPKIDGPKDILNIVRDICHHPMEHFIVLYLNANNQPVLEVESIGDTDQAPVNPRTILRKALLYHASRVIVYHSHPTGNLVPSSSDKNLTIKIKEALKHVDIDLLDHIIVSANNPGYFSFQEGGLL